jgi:hypothetical protein
MKTATVKQIKDELENLSQPELVKLCLRLIKFKKETKELATYLLFNLHDEGSYVASVEEILLELFGEVNTRNLYIGKKNLRKIIRTANRYIKYSDEVTTEIDLLIFVCQEIKKLKIDMKKSVQISNLYLSQVKKINSRIAGLHEDLQYDYEKKLAEL